MYGLQAFVVHFYEKELPTVLKLNKISKIQYNSILCNRAKILDAIWI